MEIPIITSAEGIHADVYLAAALDSICGLLDCAMLGAAEFSISRAAHVRLHGRLDGSGIVCLVGIEGTGSYGVVLGRRATAAGALVVKAGRLRGAPKTQDDTVEAIRALMVAERSARSGPAQTTSQARALVLTGPDDLRAGFASHTAAALVPRWPRFVPAPVTLSATPSASHRGSWDGAPSFPAADSAASASPSSSP